MRFLDEARCLEMAWSPRQEVDVALDQEVAGGHEAARRLLRSYDKVLDGLVRWHGLVHDTCEPHGPIGGAVIEGLLRMPEWTAARTKAEVRTSFHIAEAERRRLHDQLVDVISVALTNLHRDGGGQALRASLREAGDRVLLGWMDRDVTAPAGTRVDAWARLLKANFSTVRVYEDDDRFRLVQDPCGTCGRQLGERLHEVEHLRLAVVDGTPVYRSHVSIWHHELPVERIGAPWPVFKCPPGNASGPCWVEVFKDPLDPTALAEAPPQR